MIDGIGWGSGWDGMTWVWVGNVYICMMSEGLEYETDPILIVGKCGVFLGFFNGSCTVRYIHT